MVFLTFLMGTFMKMEGSLGFTILENVNTRNCLAISETELA